jgi:hypothetical protein
MSEHEHESDAVNFSWPIISVDGTYMHFMDDYVSLMLYQNRVEPPEEDKKSKVTLHREIVLDARLSIPTLKHIMMTADNGLKLHKVTKTMPGHQSFWGDTTFGDKHITAEKSLHDVNEINEDAALHGFFSETYSNVDDDGKKKIWGLFSAFISDNIDELKNIGREHLIEKGKENVPESK